MKARTAKLSLISVVMCLLTGSAELSTGGSASAIDNTLAKAFAGRDVHISGDKVTSYRGSTGEDVLVVEGDFSETIGADTFGGERAVIWMKRGEDEEKGLSVRAYVSGRVSAKRSKGTRVVGLNWQMLEKDLSMVVWFETGGEVFITARAKEAGDVRGLELYVRGFEKVSRVCKDFAGEFAAVSPAQLEKPANPGKDKDEVRPEPTAARMRLENSPRLEPSVPRQVEEPKRERVIERVEPAGEGKERHGVFGFIDRLLGARKKKADREEGRVQPRILYPVNLAPAGEVGPKVEWGGPEGEELATIIGRFYLWQKQDERGRLLEIQADAAVVFFGGTTEKTDAGGQVEGIQDLGAKGSIKAVYVCGDVVMTEGLRTIRADEMYYDFVHSRGIAVNAVMRSFDPGRGIPIYIRAAKVRQLAEGKFAAENVVLTTSEFYVPQISAEASSILVTDTTTMERPARVGGRIRDSSYDVQMRDVRLKAGEMTVFYWPFMRSDLERPDVPLKSVRVGNDSIWGTSVESRWYLSRLLGLQEPDGTDGTFELDYYSKRGVGAGIDVDYAQEDNLGKIIGYIIDDRGEDRLGRHPGRQDIEPSENLRGRFSWVHREFMPYNWQVTMGINYESDEDFVESYYRREFNTGLDRETYVHFKRIEDNWGLAFLGKGRLNDFADELEEYPTGEYHLTGQSIFDDKLTLYSDTQGGVYRQRIGELHATAMNEENFTFGSHRTEIDAPVLINGVKTVPFMAGTIGYDDRSGFNRSMVDGSNSEVFNEKVVGIGEGGVRASTEYWKVYRGVRSRLWDVDGLRHIVRPEFAASVYVESDSAVRQHDAVYLGLSQRLQTKRGPADNQRTVDWMRLDLGAVWVTDSDKQRDGLGPYRFLWNRPMTLLRQFSMPRILNGDLGGLSSFEFYGPQRNYFSADYSWQISDTTAFGSDAYYDMQSGTVEQLNVGFTRMRAPDLSYYIGSRYLRNVDVLDERGSNAVVFAASYVLDPRYTLVFSQQYDFDYGASIESDITLIRRYHRVFWGLTFSADSSLERSAIMFSIWPEGVPELALGSRRYAGMAGPGE